MSTRNTLAALVLLLLAPLFLLGDSVFGPRTFVPYDLAQYPPVSLGLSDEQLRATTAGQNADVTEIPVTFLPELGFAAQEVRAGRLPEWNPFARSGTPLLATSVVGLLYPPNWQLLLRDDPAAGLGVAAYGSLVLGELLMFGLLRALGLRRSAAVFGALAFVFSGTAYVNAYYFMRLPALMWLPGMLWAALAASGRQGRERIPALAGLSVSVAMAWLAGFPSYAAGSTLALGVAGAALVCRSAAARGWRQAASLAAGLSGAAVLGFALAAVQLLPMFAFFPESNRTVAPTLASRAVEAFDPASLLGYLLPDAFGHPGARDLPYDHSPLMLWLSRKSTWDGVPFLPPNYNFTEATVFPGAPVLFLALAGLLGGRRFRVVAAGTWILLATLAVAPRPLAALYELPGFRNVPPMRFIGPACAMVAILAALGVQRALDADMRKRWWGVGVVACTVALAALVARVYVASHSAADWLAIMRGPLHEHYRRADPGLGIGAVDAWIGPFMAAGRARLIDNLDYAAVGAGLVAVWLLLLPLLPRARGTMVAIAIAGTVLGQVSLARGVCGGRELRVPIDSVVHEFLREERDAARVTGGFTIARGCAADGPALAVQLPAGTLMPDRIRDLNVYTFVDKRSHLPFLHGYGPQQLVRNFWVNALPDGPGLRSRYLDLLGVRYVLAAGPMEFAGVQVGPAIDARGGVFRVYRRDSAMPRAFTVARVRVVAEPGGVPGADGQDLVDHALAAALVGSAFEPHREVLVTAATAARLGPADDSGAGRAVVFERDDPEDVVVRIAPGGRGYLVLNDTFMSGWSATIDGVPAELLRGNLFMRVIEVPPDEVVVRMRYRTPRLALGATVTAGALVVLMAGLVAWGVRRGGAAQRAAPGRATTPTA
ncbi:MAG: hypothetical protein R3F56_25150 [Planctomycetota bacterium]